MIVEGNCDGVATVWEQKPNGTWEIAHQLNGHKGEILDVSWAPNLGRDCNIIATASRDRTVRLWRLPSRLSPAKIEAHELAILPHESTVWQVEWNVLGTVLATSIDDGTSCVWASDFYGRWQLMCVSSPGKDGMLSEANDYELRRSASEGYNLDLRGVPEKEKEKGKGKEKEKREKHNVREQELIFGEEELGEAALHTPNNFLADDIDVDKRGKKDPDKTTPSRSMKKWFGANAWK